MALEYEISSWRGFEEALNSQDQEAFERLMDAARNNCMAAVNATRPVVFEAMTMSILLFQ
jgi:organic hydroperoxide reductase OsmC/OhrA